VSNPTTPVVSSPGAQSRRDLSRSVQFATDSPPVSYLPQKQEAGIRVQDQNDGLAKQVQALEQAKCLAAMQSEQTKRRIQSRQEQARHEAEQAKQRAKDVASWQAGVSFLRPSDASSPPASTSCPTRQLQSEQSPGTKKVEESLPTSPALDTRSVDAAVSDKDSLSVTEAKERQPKVTEAPAPQDQTFLSCTSVDAAVAAALKATEAAATDGSVQLLASPSESPGSTLRPCASGLSDFRPFDLGRLAEPKPPPQPSPYPYVDALGNPLGPVKPWVLPNIKDDPPPLQKPSLSDSGRRHGYLSSMADLPGSYTSMCQVETKDIQNASPPTEGDGCLESCSVMVQPDGREASPEPKAQPDVPSPTPAEEPAPVKSRKAGTARADSPKPAAKAGETNSSKLPRPASSVRRPLRDQKDATGKDREGSNERSPPAKAGASTSRPSSPGRQGSPSRPSSPGRQGSPPSRPTSSRPKAASSPGAREKAAASPSKSSPPAAEAPKASQLIKAAMKSQQGQSQQKSPQKEAQPKSQQSQSQNGRSEHLVAELEECMDTIKWSADVIKKDAVQDLKVLDRPPPAVVAVIEAAAVLIGQTTTGWERLKKLVASATFADKVQKLNPQTVSRDQFVKLRSYLEKETFDEEHMKEVCVPAVPLATWCRAVGYYLSRTKFKGGPVIQPVAAAAASIASSATPVQELVFEPDVTQMSQDDLRQVADFTISRPGVGSIHFHGDVDIAGIDLYRIVRLEVGEVRVYPDPADKPDIGVGLNRPATVTMYQCWPPKPLDATDEEKYRLKIKQMTEEKQAKFVDYNCSTGIWKFSV